MAVKINFNEAAAKTHTALIQNERAMNKSLLRLSTGMRILSAADDSAGLFIADMLGTVAAALDQGNANIQTGISALQIAETGAGQIYTKLQEIYVRAQRAANDINDPNARTALQNEINNFIDAIQKIATDTEYNGIKLLDGTFTSKYIHYGPRANQVVTVSITSVKATNLGGHLLEAPGAVTSNTVAYTGLITGDWYKGDGSDKVVVAGVDITSAVPNGTVDAKVIADAINGNATLQKLGISARATNSSTAGTDFSPIVVDSGASAIIRFYVGSNTATSNAIELTLTAGNTYTLDDIISRINTGASGKNLNLTATKNGSKLVLQTTGETIGVEVIVDNTKGPTIDLSMLLEGASATAKSGTSTASAVRVGKLTIAGTEGFSYDFNGISTASAGLGVGATGSSNFYNLNAIDVSTNSAAERALDIVTKSLQKVDSIRAQIGATMNNLQAIYDSQKSSYDNTKEAESVIRNTDYAKEMAEFTSYQIRMQATIAMLAQANTLPQLVLQLMR